MMADMTPEEAERFYEDDEDPQKIFAAFDAAPKGVTAPPAASQQAADARTLARVLSSGLYGGLRSDLLPEVASSGSNSRGVVQA
jgi:hypothetical protein